MTPSLHRAPFNNRGQALIELVVVLTVFVLLTFGVVHVGMLILVRHNANYAGFATARAAMVHETIRHGEAQAAGRDALSRLVRDDRQIDPPIDGRRGRRPGVVVTVHVPLGSLLYPTQAPRGVPIHGFAPLAIQPAIPEVGDNAH